MVVLSETANFNHEKILFGKYLCTWLSLVGKFSLSAVDSEKRLKMFAKVAHGKIPFVF